MSRSIIKVGKVYHKNEFTATIELNLDDLSWVQSLVPYGDGFRKDLQDGIDAIAKRNQLLSEKEGYGLRIVVVESDIALQPEGERCW